VSLRDDIRARVTPHLPPGESYWAAVPAVKGIQPRLAFQLRVVAVTDVRIHVFSAGLWRIGDPKRLLTSLPPGTVLRPERALHYDVLHLGGERLWVAPAYEDLLREAVTASEEQQRYGPRT
jgi:hypothetical protein